jgi:hypothetical protein
VAAQETRWELPEGRANAGERLQLRLELRLRAALRLVAAAVDEQVCKGQVAPFTYRPAHVGDVYHRIPHPLA